MHEFQPALPCLTCGQLDPQNSRKFENRTKTLNCYVLTPINAMEALQVQNSALYRNSFEVIKRRFKSPCCFKSPQFMVLSKTSSSSSADSGKMSSLYGRKMYSFMVFVHIHIRKEQFKFVLMISNVDPIISQPSANSRAAT